MIRLILTVLVSASPLVAGTFSWTITYSPGERDTTITLERVRILSVDPGVIVVGNNSVKQALPLSWVVRATLNNPPMSAADIAPFVGGALLGTLAGYMSHQIMEAKDAEYQGGTDSRALYLATGGLFGAMIGDLVGRPSSIYELSGMTPAEKVALLREQSEDTGESAGREVLGTISMNNGSEVVGTILEIFPDSTARIALPRHTMARDTSAQDDTTAQISSDSAGIHDVLVIIPEWTYSISRAETVVVSSRDIERITPFRVPEDHPEENGKDRLSFDLFAGACVPVGAFGSVTSVEAGGALSGFSCGGDLAFAIDDPNELLGSIIVDLNAFDTDALGISPPVRLTSTSWIHLWLLTGARVNLHHTHDRLFIAGQLGLVVGRSPEVTGTYFTQTEQVDATTGSGFGFALSAGGIVFDRFMVLARFRYGEPSYKVNIRNDQRSFKQQTGLMGLYVGVVL